MLYLPVYCDSFLGKGSLFSVHCGAGVSECQQLESRVSQGCQNRRDQRENLVLWEWDCGSQGPACPLCKQLPWSICVPAPGESRWVTANASPWGGTSSQRSLCLQCQHSGRSCTVSRWDGLGAIHSLCLCPAHQCPAQPKHWGRLWVQAGSESLSG